MAKPFNGKRPQDLGQTLRTFLSYLAGTGAAHPGGDPGRGQRLCQSPGHLYDQPIVNQVMEEGSLSGLAVGVAIAAPAVRRWAAFQMQKRRALAGRRGE